MPRMPLPTDPPPTDEPPLLDFCSCCRACARARSFASWLRTDAAGEPVAPNKADRGGRDADEPAAEPGPAPEAGAPSPPDGGGRSFALKRSAKLLLATLRVRLWVPTEGLEPLLCRGALPAPLTEFDDSDTRYGPAGKARGGAEDEGAMGLGILSGGGMP